jgi:hypothetical protein
MVARVTTTYPNGKRGSEDTDDGLGCPAMTDMSGRHHQSPPRHGYPPPPDQRPQGHPDQQPWADPPQQQLQPHYGYAPQQQPQSQPPQQQHYGYAPQQQPQPQPPQQQHYGYAPQQQPQSQYGFAPPQQGHPQQGHAQRGYPQEVYPQQGHPQQGHPQQGHPEEGDPQRRQLPAYQPGPHPTNELQCRFCGSYPAKQATVRGHRGIIIVMQFLSQKGPFCRDCGISTVRTMSAKTLVQGWWGYASFVITPITLLINLFQRLKFKDMPAPRPAPDGNSIAPMPLGKPVFLRPAMIFLLVPILAISAIVVAVVSGGSERYVGQCVQVINDDDITFVSCDQPNDGQVISVVDKADQCSQDATGAIERISRSRSGRETTLEVLCVK